MLRIDDDQAHLALEYKASPFGPFSADLQKLLQLMRWGFPRGRVVILCTKPYREWRLAEMGPRRGTPLRPLAGPAFSSYAEASWACFRARWREVAGRDCPVT